MKIFKILIFIFFIFIFTACSKNNKESAEISAGIIGNDIPISRGLVAKMLAFANFSKNEILSFDRVINFEDTDQNKWYDKYINAAYIKGDISGVTEEEFAPEESLTLTQTQYLIQKYDKDIKIKIDETNKDLPISYALWCEIYKNMITDTEILEDSFVILDTYNTNSKLEQNYAITDKGIFCFEGLEVDTYINKKIKVLKKDLDIIAILEIVETEPTITRAYIQSVGDGSAIIYVGGLKKSLKFENDLIKQENAGMFADIKINEDNITDITFIANEINGEIKKVTQNEIIINNQSYILDEDFKVYSITDGNIIYKSINDLYVGQDIAKFYSKGSENKLYCALIYKDADFSQINVLINKSSDTTYFTEIQISSEGGFKLYTKDSVVEYKADEILVINKDNDFDMTETESLKLELLDETKGFNIKNLQNEDNIFLGNLEIRKDEENYILLNNISLEDYIAGVLYSSNLSYKNLEFLKAFAVINRSIAIYNINQNNFKQYGANIDNITLLYNKSNLDEDIKTAVLNTEGQVIKYDGEIIYPNYFEASAGVTANSGEIWADKNFKTYPAETKPYLISKILFEDTIYEDLQEEINANIFFKSKDINFIEKDGKWTRWTCEYTPQDINKKIEEFYNKYPYFIKTYCDGEYIYSPISSIGDIKDINIMKRGEAGNVMQIEIVGTENSVLLCTDTVIREFFDIDNFIDNLGERQDNISKLPSSFFVFDKVYTEDSKISKIVFYGGGYGHGVGLSLNGANNLAAEGKNYEEILNYFYTDVYVEEI